MTSPTDPRYVNGSQGQYTVLHDMETIWAEYTGDGVSVGVYDDGIEYTHEDLAGNYDSSLHFQYDFDGDGVLEEHDPGFQSGTDAQHGTAVAGIIGAVEGNGIGGVGIAWDVSLTGVNLLNDLWGQGETVLHAALRHAENFDIMSNSWGYNPIYASWMDAGDSFGYVGRIDASFGYLSENGRDGLGTLIVQAAGNETSNLNGSGLNTSRYTISVAATDLNGDVKEYSNFGTALLISAPALNDTTDMEGSAGYQNGNYENAFNGTSAATPAISGITALMLEANEALGWRDVHNILAVSARHTGTNIGEEPPESSHEIGTWETSDAQAAGSWNGGGLTYHASYGFGMVDPLVAVRMAEVWHAMVGDAQTSDNELSYSKSTPGSDIIPDAIGTDTPGVYEREIVVNGPTDITIETVYVTVSLRHPQASDLSFYLIAPDGTEVQFAGFEIFDASSTFEWTFSIKALLGFSMNGTWKIRVEDTNDNGITGNLYSVNLEFFGTEVVTDDMHIVTDDWGMMVDFDAARAVIEDINGGTDTLNMVGLQGNMIVDMARSGSFSQDGVGMGTFGSTTDIERAFMGDGNDIVIGNGLDNEIWGMRGNDTLAGGLGADSLSGGTGNDSLDGGTGEDLLFGGDGNDSLNGGGNDDTAYFDGLRADFTLTNTTGTTWTVFDGTYTDVVVNVEYLQFNDLLVDLTTPLENTAPVAVIDDLTITSGSTVNLADILNVTDVDGDTITQYHLYDASGTSNWLINGVPMSGASQIVTDLSSVTVVGDARDGSQPLWIQVFDGTDWSAWESFNLITTGGATNVAPVAQVDDLTLDANASIALADILNVIDTDGDAITEYHLWDGTGTNNWLVNGVAVDAIEFTVSDLSSVTLQADARGAQTLWLRAADSQDWSDWTSFTLISGAPNVAADVTVDDLSIAAGTSISLSSVLNVTDAEGDTLTQYHLWDSEGASNWMVNGVVLGEDGIIVTDLSSIELIANDRDSTQTLWIRGFDGYDWSAWDSFVLTTTGAPNYAPVVTVDDVAADLGASVDLASNLSVYDDNADPIVQYQLWDSEGANNWTVNGQVITGTNAIVDASATLGLIGDTVSGTQDLWIRAFDGYEWGDWTSFTFVSGNATPTITVDDQLAPLGDFLYLSNIAQFEDLNGDAITQIELFDDTGANNWYIDGVQVTGTLGTTNDLFSVTIEADDANGTQTLWLRAHDGTDWGEWTQFDFTSGAPTNFAPEVEIADQTMDVSSLLDLDTIVFVNDPDADDITLYRIYDSVGDNNFLIDGVAVTGPTAEVSDLSSVTLQADGFASSQTLWVQAFDGTDWSEWEDFTLTTVLV